MMYLPHAIHFNQTFLEAFERRHDVGSRLRCRENGFAATSPQGAGRRGDILPS